MKQQQGRPKKPPARVKGRYLQVRVEQSEKDGFGAAADLAGLDLSAWVRERLRAVARKELLEHGRQVPFLEPK